MKEFYKLAKKPSALVFDGGVGSWPIAAGLSKVGLDVTQLGHLCKFPFGRMTQSQLKEMVLDVAVYAKKSGFDALVIASNTPTIMVGKQVSEAIKKTTIDLPIFGVEPPIEKAFQNLIQEHKALKVCVLGTKAMIESPQIRQYANILTPKGREVILENASFLIEEHVEGNSSQDEKQEAVFSFMKDIHDKHGNIPAFTLSSTHLPLLKGYFENSSPQSLFFDPAEDVIKDITKSLGVGNSSITKTGRINAVYTQPETENSVNAVNNYNQRLNNVAGIKVSITPIVIEDKGFNSFLFKR